MKRNVQLLVILLAVIFSSLLWLCAARPVNPASNPIDAATIYQNQCATCHGKNGHPTLKGKLRGAPNFTQARWQEKVSDDHIFNTISNGRDRMPAFGNKLSQAEIESLVHYIRQLKK
jgi:mono/diheme cytochrome c family protein